MEPQVAAGQRVRAPIENWTCPEAEKWEPWLAAQPLYDQISSLDERRSSPHTVAEFIAQESAYAPDINDGVRVNIAPLQRAGLLPAAVIAKKDIDKAIADRAEWRVDERRWAVKANSLLLAGGSRNRKRYLLLWRPQHEND